MATPSLVTIHGSSTLHRPAERAIVTVRVHSEGSSQQQVSKEVRNRITELRGILTKMALKDETGMTYCSCSSIIISDPFTTDLK